jgi:hypothetical protein
MRIPELVISADPTPDELQYSEDRIYEFNSSATGIKDSEWLAIFVKDDDQRIVARLCGNRWAGFAEIRQYWVDEPWRKQGLGRDYLGQQSKRRAGRPNQGCAGEPSARCDFSTSGLLVGL